MPKNEDGEFELVLGNRQLLTVFFIVVVLFGIFFAMGYVLGRPASPSSEIASTKKADKPLVVESPGRDSSPAPVSKSEPAPPPPEKPKPEPVKAEPERAAAKAEPPKKETPKPETTKPEPKQAKAEKSKPESRPITSGAPPSGTYLQLAAIAEHEASLYIDVLKKKGFKSVVMQIPEKPALYRVLVGPLPDGSLAKTKTELKAAGFPGDKAIKQTY